MDTKRIKELAGVPVNETEVLYQVLTEVVQLPDNIAMEDLANRLDHCKKALSLASKLPDAADRKKWISACFVNLNKVRGALQRMLRDLGDSAAVVDTNPAPINANGAAPAPTSGSSQSVH